MPDLMAFCFSEESQPSAQVGLESTHRASSPRHRVPALSCKMLEYRCLVQGFLSLSLLIQSSKKSKSSASSTTPSLKAKQRLVKNRSLCWGCTKFQVNLEMSKKLTAHCPTASGLILRLERNRADQKEFKTSSHASRH